MPDFGSYLTSQEVREIPSADPSLRESRGDSKPGRRGVGAANRQELGLSRSTRSPNNRPPKPVPSILDRLLEPIILQAWLTLPSCLANSKSPTFTRIIFWSWVMSCLRPPDGRAAVPARG